MFLTRVAGFVNNFIYNDSVRLPADSRGAMTR